MVKQSFVCLLSKHLGIRNLPLNCMFGTITFSQILASVLGSSNKLLYDGLSATDAKNWMALLTS